MSKAITVWLDDEADAALSLIVSTGLAESDAVHRAIIETAARTKAHPLVNDPDALERALDKNHELVAETLVTQRPPR